MAESDAFSLSGHPPLLAAVMLSINSSPRMQASRTPNGIHSTSIDDRRLYP